MPTTLKSADAEKWAENVIMSDDTMAPTINPGIQHRLNESDFDDGYALLSRRTELLKPAGDADFVRLQKELYTIEYGSFDSMSAYVSHINLLEKRINSMEINTTPDKHTLLCLLMTLPE